ncbi:dihydroneopterin aldolase [Ancylobacter mangrovi]|uniref:7,8-dihydroneopterin aldolase n=1 Tax=Ancylobacter mangrovi TaxID=2972472 RepID=A0A9X2T2T0_9HYPH|nr:dihydroneopterin aldolase [Ancylobacter mangrovi]MCS0494151.1 dihydroneopterin aldolase [Ancylobacter mangrovi]MCS0501122.1 dihydroneopterin aldolase [Ancylobacter mangrovi]
MSDRIFLRGVELHAHHGLHEEEARLGQRFVVDIDWWLDTRPAAAADDYELTVGYEKVFAVIHEVSTGRRFQMIEAFADAIAAAVLARYSSVEKVRVEVHKPAAPIAGIFRDAGVEVTRKR